MAEVVNMNWPTQLDIPAERVLQQAIDNGWERVVICGYDAEGNERFASSMADGADALWIMERCKKRLLEIVGEIGE